MSKLRELSTLVRVTRASILIIERFVDAFNFEYDCEKVPFRIQRLDELFKRHMAALVDLELSTDDTQTLGEYANQKADMEIRYNRVRDFLVSHGPTTPDSAAALCPPLVSIPNCCSVCSRPHRTAVCVQYLRLPYDQKQEVVQQKNLCRNCISASHTTRGCSSKPCWRCRQKHHLSLHPPSLDDLPPLTRSRTTGVSQPSSKKSTLTSPTLTQTEALALTPTTEHNHPQTAVPWEVQLVSLCAASGASLSEDVETDSVSPLLAKVKIHRSERKAILTQGSSLSHRIAIDRDIVSLQRLITKAQLRHSLRWCPSYAGGGLQDWLQCTAGPVLPGTHKAELHTLDTTGNLGQQLTPLAESTVNSLAHSCTLESEAFRFRITVTPVHGSLEDYSATRKLDEPKLSLLGRYSSQTRSPNALVGVSCSQLKRPGVPSTTSPYLAAEDLSPTWKVDQARCWPEVQAPTLHSVDPLVDKGAHPVGGRRGQPTSARKQARFPPKLTMASFHSPLLHAGPPSQSKLRDKEEFDTNRRGRPPEVNLATSSLRRTVGTKGNMDNVTHPTAAAVRELKHHLRRVVGTKVLTTDATQTGLCQIECCLNSRPLTAVSENPNDVTTIAPEHLLVGSALYNRSLSLTSPVFPPTGYRCGMRFSRRPSSSGNCGQRMTSPLQQPTKNLYRQPNLLVGKLVLLKKDNLPHLRWSMGRITAVFPGPDGLVRVVSVIVLSGAVYDRPVVPVNNPEHYASPSQSASSEEKV